MSGGCEEKTDNEETPKKLTDYQLVTGREIPYNVRWLAIMSMFWRDDESQEQPKEVLP